MISTPFIRDCIVNEEKTQAHPRRDRPGHVQYGMQTFDQSLFQLCQKELITYDEALRGAHATPTSSAHDPGHPVRRPTWPPRRWSGRCSPSTWSSRAAMLPAPRRRRAPRRTSGRSSALARRDHTVAELPGGPSSTAGTTEDEVRGGDREAAGRSGPSTTGATPSGSPGAAWPTRASAGRGCGRGCASAGSARRDGEAGLARGAPRGGRARRSSRAWPAATGGRTRRVEPERRLHRLWAFLLRRGFAVSARPRAPARPSGRGGATRSRAWSRWSRRGARRRARVTGRGRAKAPREHLDDGRRDPRAFLTFLRGARAPGRAQLPPRFPRTTRRCSSRTRG